MGDGDGLPEGRDGETDGDGRALALPGAAAARVFGGPGERGSDGAPDAEADKSRTAVTASAATAAGPRATRAPEGKSRKVDPRYRRIRTLSAPLVAPLVSLGCTAGWGCADVGHTGSQLSMSMAKVLGLIGIVR